LGARASARLFSLIFRQRRNYLYVHSSAGYWTRQELIASVLAPFCFLISNSHHHITILERLTAFFLALRPRNQPHPAFPSSNMAAGCCSGAAEAQGTSAHPADPHAPHDQGDHGDHNSHGHGHDHGHDHDHDAEHVDEKQRDAAAVTPNDDPAANYPKGLTLVLIITALCLAVFLVALDQTIIAPALGAITAQFQSVKDIVSG